MIDVITDRHRRGDHNIKVAKSGVPPGSAIRQGGPPDIRRLLRMEEDRLPSLGNLRGQRDVLRPKRRENDRDPVTHRLVYYFQRLPEAGSLVGGQRNLIVAAAMHHPFTAPHLSADLHDLPGAAERRVVTDAVKTLDDLWTGRADPERETTVGHVVKAGCRHRRQRGSTTVDRQDT